MRYYKHFQVFLHGQGSIIVTGLSRSQVARNVKEVKGHDAVDEVKPISVRGVERMYGHDHEQIVKANTMSVTPPNQQPAINEQLESEDFKFYKLEFVGTDETEIVIGSSRLEVELEFKQLYGDSLLSVVPIQGEELASEDPTDPVDNHQKNISLLTGRNPFITEALLSKYEGVSEESPYQVIKKKVAKKIYKHHYDHALKAMKDENKPAHEIAKRYQHVDARELQSMSEAKKGPCWDGYVKVAGKKDYEPGSCKKESVFQKKINALKEGEPMVKPKVVRNPQNKDAVEEQKMNSNPVAKYARQFNKSAVQTDKKKEAKRGSEKHKKKMFEMNELQEGEDKLMYLARIGLMSKGEVALLRRALQAKRSGQPISVQNRNILLKLMEKLVSMITNHSHMFNQARRKVMEEVINEFEDHETAGQWNNLMDWLEEAGYMDPPSTKKEIKNKYPDIDKEVKNKDSLDLQPVRYK